MIYLDTSRFNGFFTICNLNRKYENFGTCVIHLPGSRMFFGKYFDDYMYYEPLWLLKCLS